MPLDSRPRRGMAVATALVAIVLIGALIAGTFFFASQDYRVGRMTLDTDRAFTAAEYGQTTALKDWTAAAWNQNLKIGDTLKRVYATGGSSTDTVTVTRIKYNMFWVVSSGRSESGDVSSEGRRRTGLLVRMNTPQWPYPGALSGASTVNIQGQFTASGTDATPTGWTDCPPTIDPIAAVASVSTANISATGNCSTFGCLTGTPQRAGTPDAADQAKILDGWDDMVANANQTIAASATAITNRGPLLTGTACNTADPKNWGDPGRATPAGACETYFPIVHITCTVVGATCPLGIAATPVGSSGLYQQLSNGKGQGILLVDGNLWISGQFDWTGPIIVRGNFITSGNNIHVTGGVEALNQGCIAAAPATYCNIASGSAGIVFSSCAIDKIMSLKAVPTVARHHAWADMF